jgi:predicted nucleotidyltransferase
MDLHPDLKDLFSAFDEAGADYLIVGGYAVGLHGRPRYTKDLDIWIGEDDANLASVVAALERFGAPAPAIEELRRAGAEDIVWMGAPPVRVELFRTIPGVTFAPAHERRTVVDWGGARVSVIALDDLIAAKRAAAREQDLADVRALERARRPG